MSKDKEPVFEGSDHPSTLFREFAAECADAQGDCRLSAAYRGGLSPSCRSCWASPISKFGFPDEARRSPQNIVKSRTAKLMRALRRLGSIYGEGERSCDTAGRRVGSLHWLTTCCSRFTTNATPN
jgi:hypothetical protein